MTTQDKDIDTSVQTALTLFVSPLAPTQTAALDLYRRGLNVFPVPNPFEVRAWAAEDPGKRCTNDKPPYILRPLFTNRMHLCGLECWKRENDTGKLCLPESAHFEGLFSHANLAVMMGRTSGNLLDIDCDSKNAFDTICNELRRRGLPFWAFTSHRGGGFLMRLAEGEAGNITKDKSRILDVEIWGNLHYVILPPSVHAEGTVYQWFTPDPYRHFKMGEPPPMVELEALEFLGVELALKQRPKWEEPELNGLPDWTMHLSRNNRRILLSCFREGERNTNLTKPIYDIAALIVRGLVDYNEGERVLMDAAQRSNYPQKCVCQMLRCALKKEPTPSKEYKESPEYKHKPWFIAQNFGLAFDWSIFGRRAQSRRAVFFACVERSRMDDSQVFRASIREVAELSNYNKETVLSAIHDLTDFLLTRKGLSNRSDAFLYTFSNQVLDRNLDRLDENAHIPYINYPCSSCVRNTREVKTTLLPVGAECDVFYRRMVGFRVWKHLKQSPEPNAAAIARAEGLKSGSTRRALDWLLIHGLTTFGPSEGLYYGECFTEDNLEQLAAVLGTLGKSAKRKRVHERERERRINLQLARERLRWSRRYADWRA